MKKKELQEKTVKDNINANSIRDTTYIMEESTPSEALHMAEELLEQVEEFIELIKEQERNTLEQ